MNDDFFWLALAPIIAVSILLFVIYAFTTPSPPPEVIINLH